MIHTYIHTQTLSLPHTPTHAGSRRQPCHLLWRIHSYTHTYPLSLSLYHTHSHTQDLEDSHAICCDICMHTHTHIQDLEDGHAICCDVCVVAGNIDFTVKSRSGTAPFYQHIPQFASSLRSAYGLNLTSRQVPPTHGAGAMLTLKAVVVDRQTRRVLNQEDVVAAVASAGFDVTVVRLDEMSQKEQLQLGMETDLMFAVRACVRACVMFYVCVCIYMHLCIYACMYVCMYV